MSNFNKVVTNLQKSLSNAENDNLSQTLSAVRTAGGGGGGGTSYGGDGIYIEIVGNNTITLTTTAAEKLNRAIPTTVAELTDSGDYATKDFADAKYQTKESMSAYAQKTDLPDSITDFADTDTVIYSYLDPLTGDIQQQINGKQNKLQFDLNSKGEISAIGSLNNTTALVGANGITGDYYSASNPSGFINSAQAETQILAKNYITSGVSVLDNFYSKTDTSSRTELQTKFDSLLDYDVVTGNSAVLITTADANNTRTFTISLTATPTAADTVLNGQNGVDATLNGNVWNVGLSQSAYNAVNNVQNKLDTTAAAQTYQPKGNYLSSNALDGYATQQWVGDQGYLTQVPSEYVTDTELQTTLGDYATKTLVQNTSADITALIPSTAGLASETDLQIVSAGVDYVSAHAITAHQSLTNYYTKSETSGAIELSTEFAKYQPKGNYLVADDITGKLDKSIYANASGNWENTYNVVNQYSAAGTWLTAHQNLDNYYTKTQVDSTFASATQLNNYLTTAQYQTDSATFALKSDLNGLVNSASVTTNDNYVMTNSGWKVLTLPGGGMTQVYHDTTLTGDGNANDNQLGVKWETLSSNTIAYSNSAFNLTNGTSVSSFDQISAAIDSRYSKTASDNRYLQKSLDNTLTGDGKDSSHKLGVAWSALSGNTINSALSAGSATSADKAESAVSAKWLREGDAHVSAGDVTALQHWASSNSSTWDLVSAKSTVSANTATNVISVSANSTETTANLSATTYYTNTADSNLVAQRLFVVHNDADLVAHVTAGLCQGQGSLFFVMSGFNN